VKAYNFKLKIEGQGSPVATTERAENAVEAEQKVRERYGRLYNGKAITIIYMNPKE
jgi:hypothetical protein